MTTEASSSGPRAGPLPESTLSSTSASALDRLGVAVESAVTQALDATERSLARRVGGRVAHAVRLTLRLLLWAALLFYFVFGIAFLWTRYWVMPRIDTYRPWIEASAAKALQTRVTIGRIHTGWRGLHPHLRL
ncbi:MAG TPA: hypothetical protein VFR86_29180, partial [Burkholderiaceae bacterium]|nr:hypothetical protein [Burkholderiaceae bacterium]